MKVGGRNRREEGARGRAGGSGGPGSHGCGVSLQTPLLLNPKRAGCLLSTEHRADWGGADGGPGRGVAHPRDARCPQPPGITCSGVRAGFGAAKAGADSARRPSRTAAFNMALARRFVAAARCWGSVGLQGRDRAAGRRPQISSCRGICHLRQRAYRRCRGILRDLKCVPPPTLASIVRQWSSTLKRCTLPRPSI